MIKPGSSYWPIDLLLIKNESWTLACFSEKPYEPRFSDFSGDGSFSQKTFDLF